MRIGIVISVILIIFQFASYSQIVLDEDFGEWKSLPILHADPIDANFGLEFTNIKVSNDEEFIYFLLYVGSEINLQDNNNLEIYLDTDADPNTGFLINGIGADLRYFPGQRFGFLTINNINYEVRHDQSGWVNSPTVTSNIFEFCLSRSIFTKGRLLEMQDQIQLFLRNGPTGDILPNQGVLSYQFDNEIEQAQNPFSIRKLDNEDLRILTYNALRDRIFTSTSAQNSFRNILRATQPDIICFQEIYDHSAQEVADLMDEWIPLDNSNTWSSAQEGPDIITLSKYPIIGSQNIGTNGAFKIQYDDQAILVVNAHLPCCDNEDRRQFEVDQILEYIRESKNGNAILNVTDKTPIIICGDMNFVGEAQQPTSLRDGNIINEDIFGDDLLPDWDGSEFKDAKPITTGRPFTFSWNNPSSSFSAGRLDYIIYTGSVLKLKNAYNLYTPSLSFQDLDNFRLNAIDTDNASDHLPGVADFEIGEFTSTNDLSISNLKVWPNPGSGIFNFDLSNSGFLSSIFVYDIYGREVLRLTSSSNVVDLSSLDNGIYNLKLMRDNFYYNARILKLNE